MSNIFVWILRISAEAAILAVLILGARAIIARRPGIWLTLLYALIALRLIVPFTVSSPLSVQNIWPIQSAQIVLDQNTESVRIALDYDAVSASEGTEESFKAPVTQPVYEPANDANSTANVSNLKPDVTGSAQQAAAKQVPLLEIGVCIWIAGMVILSGIILTGNVAFRRRLRHNRDYDDPQFTKLLAECRAALGLKKKIRAIRASEAGTAAVYGILRPMLLISPQAFEALNTAQKRHVLMHELSHIRRLDTLVCTMATVLNIIHWFNPLLWIVFALMRRDIEVQCDAYIFRTMPATERTDYAGTLLTLAGPVQTPKLAPALFISKASVKRRIVMVVRHKKKSGLFTAVALLLTLLVAVTGCTTAMDYTAADNAPLPETQVNPAEQTPPAAPSETATADGVTVTPASTPAKEPELMATFTVDNSNHNNANRMYNVQKAADLINGLVIKPGETISLNDILGPRKVATGWKEAAGIEGNAYVAEPGGGVCAVSSAIYNAAIRAELDIVEVKQHSIPADYIDPGLDASISTGSPDLKIKNSYGSDVTIETVLEDMLLTVNIYGPPLGYTVDFRSEKAGTGETPETQYIYNTETAPDGTVIPPGKSLQYRAATPEKTFDIYKTQYDLDGNEINTLIYAKITYGPVTGIIYVNGPDPNKQ